MILLVCLNLSAAIFSAITSLATVIARISCNTYELNSPRRIVLGIGFWNSWLPRCDGATLARRCRGRRCTASSSPGLKIKKVYDLKKLTLCSFIWNKNANIFPFFREFNVRNVVLVWLSRNAHWRDAKGRYHCQAQKKKCSLVELVKWYSVKKSKRSKNAFAWKWDVFSGHRFRYLYSTLYCETIRYLHLVRLSHWMTWNTRTLFITQAHRTVQ